MPSEMSTKSGPFAPDAGDRSSSSKRRRTSEHSSLAVTDQPDANHAHLSPTPRALTRGSPQRGSSRDMTPPEGSGSIKYTRTGRVSKATKGQRIHHCEECGKTYTRAEHLRRHQQNHKPGAFPCDVSGCARSFYREDLLTRHKARHDDPLNPPSRPQSRASQDSHEHLDRPLDNVFRPAIPRLPSNASASDEVTTGGNPGIGSTNSGNQRNTKAPIVGSGLQHALSLPITANDGLHHDSMGGAALWGPSPPYSPRYDSPTNNDGPYTNPGLPYYHQPHPSRPRLPSHSHTSYLGYDSFQQATDTPESAGSSTVCLPHWANSAQDFAGGLNSSSDSEASCTAGMGGLYNTAMTEQVVLPGTYGSSQLLMASDRDLMEKDDLIVPPASRHDSIADLNVNEPVYTNEDRYLGAYWLWVHPLYPVLHRPTFSLHHSSPLLKAAILALGAHALGDALDKTNARIVHERCMKALKKRTLNNWHTFRLCDMQAVVLVEVYAVFKSRRPPLQFAKAFEDVYNYLANDHEALNPLPADLVTQGSASYLDGLGDSTAQATGILCKQRLLAACYILDSQHVTLFGRQRTSCYAGAGIDLPFPTSLVTWDGQRRQQQRLEPHDRVWQALDGGNIDEPAQSRPYDVFQSMLMIACLTDSSNESEGFYPSDPNKDLAPIVGAMQQSAQIKLAYNTFMLCKHTPIRNLLAVAGESWIMAEKMSSAADYAAAQLGARNWANASGYMQMSEFNSATGLDEEMQPAVQKAVRHALRIIELHVNHPKTGLLFQEWSVYLAVVVIWAHAHVSPTNKSARRPRLSVPDPAQPNVSTHEIEQTVTAVVAKAGRVPPDREEARRVLLWAKAAIEKVDLPHNCGLTNGALDVLGKLVSRGSEDGWFGM